MPNQNFVQTWRLTRFTLRRDWLKLTIWLVALAGLLIAVAAKFQSLYGTTAQINGIKRTLQSPAMVSLLGYFNPHLHYTTATIFANEMMVFMGIMMVIMNITIAIKATRSEEDNGVTEMLQANAIGRLAPLSAAAIELFLINLIFTIVSAGGLVIANMPGSNMLGDLLIGTSLGGIGLLFGMLALVTAQLGGSASQATILTYIVFGLTYLIRVITDISNPDNTWWSPFGWIEKAAPYHGNHSLSSILLIGSSLVLLMVAFQLNLHRDTGAGLISAGAGRQRASSVLRGPLSLLLRLERTTLIAWIIGIAIFAAMYGSIFNTIGDVLKTNPTMQIVFGKAVVHSANHTIIISFAAVIMLVLNIVASIPAIQIATKLKSDEAKGWLEPLHAKPISRTRILGSYAVVASVGGALIDLAATSGLMLIGNSTLKVVSERITTQEFWQAYAAGVPTVLVMAGFTLLLVSALPKLTNLIWLILGYGLLSTYLGPLLKLPKWATQLTPFGWMPHVPQYAINWTTFWLMMGLTVVLAGLSWFFYQWRDLEIKN